MASTIEVKMPRRSVDIDLSYSGHLKKKYDTDVVSGFLLGIYQYTDSGDAYPLAICELNNGDVIGIAPEALKFTYME